MVIASERPPLYVECVGVKLCVLFLQRIPCQRVFSSYFGTRTCQSLPTDMQAGCKSSPDTSIIPAEVYSRTG